MHTGKTLASALASAIELKGVRQEDVAAAFGVKQPSVSDWLKHGRMHKKHLTRLVEYFGDVVGPEHWGMPSSWRPTSAPLDESSPLAAGIAYVQELFDRDPQRFEVLVGDLKKLMESLREADAVMRSHGAKSYTSIARAKEKLNVPKDEPAPDTYITGSAEKHGISGFGALTEVEDRKPRGTK